MIGDTVLLPAVGSGSVEENSPATAPWFSTYNRNFNTTTTIYQFSPFQDHKFCAHSPWEDHVIIGHHGIEPFAKAEGFEVVNDYLKHRIASAPKRGAFCARCPSAVRCSG